MPQGYNGLPPFYVQSSDPITPNLGLSLKGMDPIVAEDFYLVDTAFGSVGGSIDVNGVAVPAPANFINSASVTFSVVGSNISLTAAGAGAVLWNQIGNPNGNFSLSTGTNLTSISAGDFGASPVAYGSGIFTISDNSTNSADNSYDFAIIVPSTSFHNALYVGIDGFAQLQVSSTDGASQGRHRSCRKRHCSKQPQRYHGQQVLDRGEHRRPQRRDHLSEQRFGYRHTDTPEYGYSNRHWLQLPHGLHGHHS